jgi:hypothetical protein
MPFLELGVTILVYRESARVTLCRGWRVLVSMCRCGRRFAGGRSASASCPAATNRPDVASTPILARDAFGHWSQRELGHAAYDERHQHVRLADRCRRERPGG